MTALRYFATAKPSEIGAKVLPMSREDERFWQIFHARRIDARSDETGTGSARRAKAGSAGRAKRRAA